MGYHLSIEVPNIGSFGADIGGKFFGYLDDDTFKLCYSYQYLKDKVADIDMLNVWWYCYSFELEMPQALAFLRCYAADVKRFKNNDSCVDEIMNARSVLYSSKYDGKVIFSLG